MKTLRVLLSLSIIGVAVWGMVYDVLNRPFYSFSIDTSSLEESESDLNIRTELQNKGFNVRQDLGGFRLTGGELVAKELSEWVNTLNEQLQKKHRERQSTLETERSAQKQLIAQIEQKRSLKERHLEYLKSITITDLKPFEPWASETTTQRHHHQKNKAEPPTTSLSDAELGRTPNSEMTSGAPQAVVAQSSNLIFRSPDDQHLNVEVLASRHPHFKLLLSSRDEALQAMQASANMTLSSSSNTSTNVKKLAVTNKRQQEKNDQEKIIASANTHSTSNQTLSEIAPPALLHVVELEKKPQASGNQLISLDVQQSTSKTDTPSHQIASGNMSVPPFIGALRNEFQSHISSVSDHLSSTVHSLSRSREDKLEEMKFELQLSQTRSLNEQQKSMAWFSNVYTQVFDSLKLQAIWRKQWLQNTTHRLQSELLALKHQEQSLSGPDLMVSPNPPHVLLSKRPSQLELSELKHGYRYLLFGFAACFALNLIWEAISQRSRL